jgi:hypothetical protein
MIKVAKSFWSSFFKKLAGIGGTAAGSHAHLPRQRRISCAKCRLPGIFKYALRRLF